MVAIRSQERVLGFRKLLFGFGAQGKQFEPGRLCFRRLLKSFITKQIRDQRAAMSNFQQAQQEGLCLRYPENLGLHREISYENAAAMLLRAVSMSQNVPFAWGFVDKPVGWLRYFHSWGRFDN